MSATHHAARRESPLARLTRLARRQPPATPDDRDGRSELWLAAEARRDAAEMNGHEWHHEAPADPRMPVPPGMPGLETRTWVTGRPPAAIAHRKASASPVHMVADETAIMPCCGFRETDVPRTDFVTANPSLVTCDLAARLQAEHDRWYGWSDTMPDDRAPHARPYVPEPEAPAYVPGLAADIRDLPGLRAAIECHALRLHPGCQCAPEGDAEYLAWLASQYADLRPAQPSWWAAEPVHEAETAEMEVAA